MDKVNMKGFNRCPHCRVNVLDTDSPHNQIIKLRKKYIYECLKCRKISEIEIDYKLTLHALERKL